MGQHKYNPTAIKAKNGEIEPKKKPSANPITKAEVYEAFQDDVIATFHTVDEMNRYLLQSLGEEDD